MPLVNAKCTNCGANLEVESGKDAAICPYCGSAYIVEKAINNYNITNNTTNNINADVVNVYGGVDTGFKTRGGVLEKYEGESIDIIIPETVIIIGTNSFSGCYGIRSVKIPEGVKTIEPNAFSGCTGLQSVSIAEGIDSIGENAFSGCTGLQSVSIPGSVETIGEHAFAGCTSLQNVSIAEGVELIGKEAFSGCIGLQSVSIPGSVKAIEEQAFSCCRELEEITLPDNLQIVRTRLFAGCTSLKSIVLPNSVNAIESEAFDSCISLSYLEIKGNPSVSKKRYKQRYDGFYDSVLIEEQDCFKISPIGRSEEAVIIAPDEWLIINGALFPSTIEKRKQQQREWQQQKRCVYCGGEFTGRILKKCSVCGKEKNY